MYRTWLSSTIPIIPTTNCAKHGGPPTALAIRLEPVEMRGSGDLEKAFATVAAAHCDALYVVSSRHTTLNTPTIVNFASQKKIPLAGGWGAWARAGGLLSYGPNVNEMYQHVLYTLIVFFEEQSRETFLFSSLQGSN